MAGEPPSSLREELDQTNYHFLTRFSLCELQPAEDAFLHYRFQKEHAICGGLQCTKQDEFPPCYVWFRTYSKSIYTARSLKEPVTQYFKVYDSQKLGT